MRYFAQDSRGLYALAELQASHEEDPSQPKPTGEASCYRDYCLVSLAVHSDSTRDLVLRQSGDSYEVLAVTSWTRTGMFGDFESGGSYWACTTKPSDSFTPSGVDSRDGVSIPRGSLVRVAAPERAEDATAQYPTILWYDHFVLALDRAILKPVPASESSQVDAEAWCATNA